MPTILNDVAEAVAIGCEFASLLIVALGSIAALARLAWNWRELGDLKVKKEVWLGFAANILLALEFALAADIARTAIEPNWEDIGRLAAIAAIRTALNFFLERDLEAARTEQAAQPRAG
ncbi:DUF1622 domain-containing protein [Phenylobacterium terrae]|uniref:DUF1622 domain-containing protein n=1 Tax=Phenylobacterium terrae TaxID=2665495 RepID=A0ABW4N222_9CAUL